MNETTFPKSKHLTYVLRQSFPDRAPRSLVNDLIHACKTAGIEEVLFFPLGIGICDTNSGFWPQSHAEKIKENLIYYRERLGEHGIGMGLNIWHNLGHNDGGRIASPDFPFRKLVCETGSEAQSLPCPLDKRWQEYFLRWVDVFASTKPTKIFLDDDFRWLHHTQDNGDGGVNCFCEEHIRIFNEEFGSSHDRASLVKAILAPGKPQPERRAWFAMLNRQLTEVAGAIEARTHSISPETEVCSMISLADLMIKEGRDFDALLSRLAGSGRRILTRPCYQDYSELHMRQTAESYALYQQIFPYLPDGTVDYAEMDNCHPGIFNQSPNHMAMRMLLIAMTGRRRFHLSLCGMMGNRDTITQGEPYFSMLKAFERSTAEILQGCEGNAVLSGIGIPANPQACLEKRLRENATMSDYSTNSYSWAMPLQHAGLPITFDPSPIMALTRDNLWGMPEAQIRGILSKAVILDFPAMDYLVDMGLGHLIGVKTCSLLDMSIQSTRGERIVEEESPLHGDYFNHKALGRHREGRLTLLDAAKPITVLCGREGAEYGPGAFTFRNEYGGNILGIPLFPEALDSSGFLNVHRLDSVWRWVEQAMKDSGKPFIMVREHPYVLPIHARFEGKEILLGMNLYSQSCEGITMRGYHLTAPRKAYLWEESQTQEIEFSVEQDGTMMLIQTPARIRPMCACIFVS